MQAGLGERLAAAVVALAGRPAFVDPAAAVELPDRPDQGLVPEVQFEDSPNANRFVVVNQEFGAVRVDIVSQERHPAGPLALTAGGGNLVAGPLGNHFPLELGKG